LERLDLQPWLELLPDPQGTLSAPEARDHPGFVPNAEGTNSLGFTREALWVRFSLKGTPDGSREVLLELAYPLLDEVTLDLVFPDGRRLKRRKGVHFARQLRVLAEAYADGAVTLAQVTASVQGWVNHVRYGNTVGLRRPTTPRLRFTMWAKP
jgi:hypothetical protein